MQTTKKGFFNIAYSLLGQLILIGFSIVTPILVIENYGSETNGLLHSAAQIFTYLSLLEAGVGSATIQALYGPLARQDDREVSAIMAATGIYFRRTGILYTAGVAAFAFLYPVLVQTSLPYFLVVGVVLCTGLGSSLNYFYYGKYALLMQADGHAYVTAKINILINVLTNVIKIILLLRGYSVLAVQLSFFLLQAARAVCYHFYVRRKYGHLDFSIRPDFEAISQKKAVLVHQLSYLVFSSTDVLLLTFLTQDLKIVSVYTLYNSIVTMLFTLVSQISSGFDFKLGQLFATDREQYNRLYHVFEIIHLVLIFSVMSALYVIFLPFMRTYTAHVTDINYVNAWYPLCFVLVPLLTHGRTSASSTITFAGHFEQTKQYSVVETVINLTVSVGGILLLGIPGALLGTIIASLYRTVNIYWYAYRHLLPDSPWRSIKRWALCFIIFAGVILTVYLHPLQLHQYLQILLAAAGSGLAMLAVYSLAQYCINREERALLVQLIRQFIRDIFSKMKGLSK